MINSMLNLGSDVLRIYKKTNTLLISILHCLDVVGFFFFCLQSERREPPAPSID